MTSQYYDGKSFEQMPIITGKIFARVLCVTPYFSHE